MPQLQLPIFPQGLISVTEDLAVERRGGRVVYFHGLLPVFEPDEQDVKSFRMFTSRLIANGRQKRTGGGQRDRNGRQRPGISPSKTCRKQTVHATAQRSEKLTRADEGARCFDRSITPRSA